MGTSLPYVARCPAHRESPSRFENNALQSASALKPSGVISLNPQRDFHENRAGPKPELPDVHAQLSARYRKVMQWYVSQLAPVCGHACGPFRPRLRDTNLKIQRWYLQNARLVWFPFVHKRMSNNLKIPPLNYKMLKIHWWHQCVSELGFRLRASACQTI